MTAPSEQFPDLYRAMLVEAERRESLEIVRLRKRCQELHSEIRRLKRGETEQRETGVAA